jgi:predicted dehydrogenase
MAMNKKVALAGIGAAARQIHLPALAKLPNMELVGAYDPAVRSQHFPCPLFSTAEEMLERARPDILIVAAPPASHFELTRLGLQAGCHVLCEKPFMTTLEEASEIVALAKEVKRWVVVNNQYRFMNIHAAAKKKIGNPEFGELLFVSVQQTFCTTENTEAGWRGQGRRRTCLEFGTHVLDLCRFFFGEEPLRITAHMPRSGNPQGPDLLDLILVEFSGGRVAQITLDRLWRGPTRYLTIRLDGSNGCIETELGGHLELSAGIRGGSRTPYLSFDFSPGGRARLLQGEKSRKIATEPLDVFASATSRLLQAFVEALEHDKVPVCNAQDNLRTLALMLAAYESDDKRQTIELDFSQEAQASGAVPASGEA